jgi:MFS family permease
MDKPAETPPAAPTPGVNTGAIPAKLDRFGPLRSPGFRMLTGARAFSVLATQVQSVAIGWQVYDLARRSMDVGNSAFLLGMVGAAQFVPLFLLSLYGGQAADRYDRTRIVLACTVGKALISLVLLATAFLDPARALPAIFIAAAATGALNAFLPPASQALIAAVVPRADLPQAVALGSLAFQGGAIIGPALGGTIYAAGPALGFTGSAAAYGVSLAMFAGAALFALRIKAPRQPRIDGVSTLELMREGLAYVRRNKIVLGAMSLDLAVVLLAGVSALLPVYARDLLHTGPDGLGLMRAAPALGAAAVAVILSLAPIRDNVGRWMFGCVAVFGVATIGFGLSREIWISVALLAITGAADMISVFVRNSLVQLATPDEMRGRVSAVSFVFISASNELGEFESGVAARLIGPIGAVLFGGGAAVVLAGLWARLFPQLASARRFADARVEAIRAAGSAARPEKPASP